MHSRILLLICSITILAACSGETRRSAVESLRSAFNPPAPPADTIPEALDYAADLQVDIGEMAKLPAGVLYADSVPGEGIPVEEGDSVLISYQGWLPNGTKVDSVDQGARIGAGDVIPGIDAALPGMKPGGLRKLVLSPGLGFGSEGRDNIPPNAVLVYDVELRARVP